MTSKILKLAKAQQKLHSRILVILSSRVGHQAESELRRLGQKYEKNHKELWEHWEENFEYPQYRATAVLALDWPILFRA